MRFGASVIHKLGIPEYVSWYPLGDRIVVLDLRSRRSYELNGAAAALWLCCVERRSTDSEDLARTLVGRYRINAATATRDSALWAKDFLDKHLLYSLAA